jgi:hypothetical protein
MFIFEPAFFTYNVDEALKMSKAMDDFCERILGAKSGTFHMSESMREGMIAYFGGDKNENNI